MKSKLFKRAYLLGLAPITICILLCGGSLTVQPVSCDLGEAQYGQLLHHRFTIKNPSIIPARIESAIPACECTHAKLTSKRIPPLGKAYMDVTFDTKGFHGKATRFIDIEVSKPRRQDWTAPSFSDR